MRSFLLILVLSLAACADEPTTPPPASDAFTANAGPESVIAADGVASAVIAGLDGSGVSGTAVFREADGAVRVRIALDGLAPGEHGFHVHEGESCGPDSTGTAGGAAGGHFNPLASPHGAPSAPPPDRHAGDLGNVTANAEGVATGVVVDSVLTLTGPTSAIGHAVVVHAGRDDLTSQPSGDAGARVGCGVVREGAPGEAAPSNDPDAVSES